MEGVERPPPPTVAPISSRSVSQPPTSGARDEVHRCLVGVLKGVHAFGGAQCEMKVARFDKRKVLRRAKSPTLKLTATQKLRAAFIGDRTFARARAVGKNATEAGQVRAKAEADIALSLPAEYNTGLDSKNGTGSMTWVNDTRAKYIYHTPSPVLSCGATVTIFDICKGVHPELLPYSCSPVHCRYKSTYR